MYCLGIQSKVTELSQALNGSPGILSEVRRIGRRGDGRLSVDRRQQHQIAPRIVDLAAADRQAVTGPSVNQKRL